MTQLICAVLDLIFLPLTIVGGLWLKTVRRVGVNRMKISRVLFNKIGVFPIRDHYYEPLFNPKSLRRDLAAVRALPALDLNVAEQLSLLSEFHFQSELLTFPREEPAQHSFFYNNPNFGS